MEYLKALLKEVEEKKYKHSQIKSKIINVNKSGVRFTSISLYEILSQLKGILRIIPFRERQKNYTIHFNIKETDFTDKITYMLFDAIIYDLFNSTGFDVTISGDVACHKCSDNGMRGCVFQRFFQNRTFPSMDYVKMYKTDYLKEDVHRKYISRSEIVGIEDTIPTKILQDVNSFLNIYFSDAEWTENIAEAVSELVDNALRHSTGDILLDIDVSDAIPKEMDEKDAKKTFKNVNIAFLNISEIRLFDKLKENIVYKKYDEDDKIYSKVYLALDNHKNFFDEYYTENFFFLVTAFQKRVTTRQLMSGSNGTGLTKLIENILETTDEDFSYVLSGNELLKFSKDNMRISGDFIGFNESGDYVNQSPDRECILRSELNIPGTIYNLYLIKGEQNDND